MLEFVFRMGLLMFDVVLQTDSDVSGNDVIRIHDSSSLFY